jgi:hypothetical protein
VNGPGSLLQVASGVCAVLAAALLAYRVLGLPATPPAPAIYAPEPAKPPKAGQFTESERPATGFIIVVESVPEGALLSVDGVENGETPASLNLDCKPGSSHALKLTAAGFAPVEHAVACKKDVMLVVSAKLKKL